MQICVYMYMYVQLYKEFYYLPLCLDIKYTCMKISMIVDITIGITEEANNAVTQVGSFSVFKNNIVEKKVTEQRSHPRNNFVPCMPSNSQLNFWGLLSLGAHAQRGLQ